MKVTIPCIAETPGAYKKYSGYDAINLYLDANQKNSLSWPHLEEEIEEIRRLGGKIAFEIDFGLDPDSYNFHDSIGFFSLSIAIEQFNQRVREKCLSEMGPICLYRGRGDFSKAILRNQGIFLAYQEWLSDLDRSDQFGADTLKIFSIKMVMEYLHRLSSALPEEVLHYVVLDLRDVENPLLFREMLSEEYFPYIKPLVIADFPLAAEQPCFLGAKEISFSNFSEPTLGIVLPNRADKKLLNALFSLLDKNKIGYRTFPEHLMVEQWSGLDDMLVMTDSISDEGIRMLKGFIAAAGRVVTMGGREFEGLEKISVDMYLEEKIGAEGFEPPTLWSQTRCASQAALCPE